MSEEKQYFTNLNDYWVKDANAHEFMDLDLCAGKHIVMFGDSNAARASNLSNSHTGYLFEELQKRMPKATFAGYAKGGAGFIAGETIKEQFNTFIEKFNNGQEKEPNIIFVWAGGNDIAKYSQQDNQGNDFVQSTPVDLLNIEIKEDLTNYEKDIFYQADYILQQMRVRYPKAQICGVIRTYKRGFALRGRQEYFYGMLAKIYQKNKCSIINLNDFSQITQLENENSERIQSYWEDAVHYNELAFKNIICDIFYQALKNNLNINTFIPIDEIYQNQATGVQECTRATFQDGVAIAGTKLLRTNSGHSIISGGRCLGERFTDSGEVINHNIILTDDDAGSENDGGPESVTEDDDVTISTAGRKKTYIARDEFAWMRMATRKPSITYAYGELDTGDFLMLEKMREVQQGYPSQDNVNQAIDSAKNNLAKATEIFNQFIVVCDKIEIYGKDKTPQEEGITPNREWEEYESAMRHFKELMRNYYNGYPWYTTLKTPQLGSVAQDFLPDEESILDDKVCSQSQIDAWTTRWMTITTVYNKYFENNNNSSFRLLMLYDYNNVYNYYNTYHQDLRKLQPLAYGRKANVNTSRILTAQTTTPLTLSQKNYSVILQNLKDLPAGTYMIQASNIGQYTGFPANFIDEWVLAADLKNDLPYIQGEKGCILTIYSNSGGFKWATLTTLNGGYWIGQATSTALVFTWFQVPSQRSSTITHQIDYNSDNKTWDLTETSNRDDEQLVIRSFKQLPYLMEGDQCYLAAKYNNQTQYIKCNNSNKTITLTTNSNEAQLFRVAQRSGAYRLFYTPPKDEGSNDSDLTYRLASTSDDGLTLSTEIDNEYTLWNYQNGQFTTFAGGKCLALTFNNNGTVAGLNVRQAITSIDKDRPFVAYQITSDREE